MSGELVAMFKVSVVGATSKVELEAISELSGFRV
jgi:hypothetical protein